MNVNWKVRFKNKAWLTSFFAAILTFVYTILGMFDIYPEVTKNDVGEIVNSVLMFMSLMGIIIDPTTAGLGDSQRALGYDVPYSDYLNDDGTEEHVSEPEDIDAEVVEDSDEETHG